MSYLKEMAKELGSALFLTRKAPSRGTLISMFSAWLLDRLAWYHLEQQAGRSQHTALHSGTKDSKVDTVTCHMTRQ